MRIVNITLLVLISQPVLAQSTSYQSVLPVGSIKKGTTITVQAADADTTYFDPNSSSQSSSTTFQNVSSSDVYKVKTLSSSSSDADTSTLQTLASSNQLVLQKSDLSSGDASCVTTGTCTLTTTTAVSKSGNFDFFNWFLNLFGLGTKPQSLVTPAVRYTPTNASAAATTEGIQSASSFFKKSTSGNFCDLPEKFKFSPKLQCGLRLAKEAYQKAKDEGKVTNGTFIFNDFSEGHEMGSMYFLNSDGTAANVLDKNPIDVAGGDGGFSNKPKSMGTPDGALVTRNYRPPRSGNIKDGIELDGLESDNNNTHGRGILIHGWNVYSPTQGCLGLPGMLDTDTKGRRRESPNMPPYLDTLKQDLLKNGGVMIYNFTPKRASQCKS